VGARDSGRHREDLHGQEQELERDSIHLLAARGQGQARDSVQAQVHGQPAVDERQDTHAHGR
jgi:hypothetical protein